MEGAGGKCSGVTPASGAKIQIPSPDAWQVWSQIQEAQLKHCIVGEETGDRKEEEEKRGQERRFLVHIKTDYWRGKSKLTHGDPRTMGFLSQKRSGLPLPFFA